MKAPNPSVTIHPARKGTNHFCSPQKSVFCLSLKYLWNDWHQLLSLCGTQQCHVLGIQMIYVHILNLIVGCNLWSWWFHVEIYAIVQNPRTRMFLLTSTIPCLFAYSHVSYNLHTSIFLKKIFGLFTFFQISLKSSYSQVSMINCEKQSSRESAADNRSPQYMEISQRFSLEQTIFGTKNRVFHNFHTYYYLNLR